MAATKRLYLEFETAGGNTKAIVVDDPKENLDLMTVTSNMDAIITANVFDVKGHDLETKKAAYIREVVTTKII